jgi:prophage regulatory protein
MPTTRPSPRRQEPLRFVRLPTVLARRGTSSSTTYRHVAAGLLPPPVKLGPNTSAWVEHELDAVDAARVAGATEDEVRSLVAKLVAERRVDQ